MTTLKCDNCGRDHAAPAPANWYTVYHSGVLMHFCQLECIAAYYWKHWEDYAA